MRSNAIAFLSADSLDGYVADDHLAEKPLEKLGWSVETVSWRNRHADWSKFAAVIIRTTWDYHKNLPEFLGVLKQVESKTKLANPLPIVRWNANKTYLRELETQGAKIVRTIWWEGTIEDHEVERWFAELQSDEIVIKPTVSASAEDTLRLHKTKFQIERDSLADLAGRQYMVQPFMNSIVEEGEFSLFYFCGEYSHAILKTPKSKDFRVQEEHGGLIRAIQPMSGLIKASAKVMELLKPPPLYARIDFVRDEKDFALMELELIEPALYLRMDENAPQRFANAISSWVS